MYLERRALKSSKPRPQKPILTFSLLDNDTSSSPTDESENDSDFEENNCTFSSPCAPPELMFVNRETHDLCLSWGYEQAFGEAGVLPTTWFNFEIDTLYLDWGYGCPGGTHVDYVPTNFGDEAKRVRHLALYQSIGSHNYHRRDSEGWLCDILDVFSEMESLAFVDQFHTLGESSDVSLIDRTSLRLWPDREVYGSCDTVNDEELREHRDSWFDDGGGPSPWKMNDEDVKEKRRRWEEDGVPPWKMPEITYNSATSTRMKDKLERICDLGDLDELNYVFQGCLLSIDQQIAFGKLRLETLEGAINPDEKYLHGIYGLQYQIEKLELKRDAPGFFANWDAGGGVLPGWEGRRLVRDIANFRNAMLGQELVV